MFFLVNVFGCLLLGWHLLSAAVGALFDNILMGIIVGDIWMALSFLAALLLGAIIRAADEREGTYPPYRHNSRYAA